MKRQSLPSRVSGVGGNRFGKNLYPDKKELLITADGGSSNGEKYRIWKKKLQEFANEEQLTITVTHYPPRHQQVEQD
jgi:hypothetical protein